LFSLKTQAVCIHLVFFMRGRLVHIYIHTPAQICLFSCVPHNSEIIAKSLKLLKVVVCFVWVI